jgi:hypothetical protein
MPLGIGCKPRALWTFGRCPQNRTAVLCAAGCLDGLTVVATLAHEMYWTFCCWEAPRRSAADSQCRVPRIAWFHACAYFECLRDATRPAGSGFRNKLRSSRAPFGMFRVGQIVFVVLPRDVGHLGRCCPGYIAHALGHG